MDSNRPIHSMSLGITFRPKASGLLAKKKKPMRKIIVSSKLIPGDGEPIKDGALVVEDGVIIWLGTRTTVPEEYIADPHKLHVVPYLMPGLWDVHVHMSGPSAEEGGSRYTAMMPNPTAAGARLARGCWEMLQQGYTSVRDLAGYGPEMAAAVNDGSIVGPNIYGAGACLSQLAGHGDLFDMPAGDVLLSMGAGHVHPGHWGNTMGIICDGVPECIRAVRLQIRRGAKCIKILASGGILSLDDNPEYAQFSEAELDAIMAECKRFNRSVAAHVIGNAGTKAAIKAGVRSCEHVDLADQEVIDLMKEHGTIYVATCTITRLLFEMGESELPEKIWEKLKRVVDRQTESYKLAIKSGLTIALGTDTNPGFPFAKEIEWAVKHGMTNLEAIKAATANGPLTVEGQVGKTGQLKVGYEADMIGVMEDPTEDVTILQDQDNIGWVWKRGRLFKGPGVPLWGETD